MKPSIRSKTARHLRSSGILAALWIAPLVGGCVSALDDTTAFGYNKNGPAALAENANATAKGGEADAGKAADTTAVAAIGEPKPAGSESKKDPGNSAAVAAVDKEAGAKKDPEAPIATGQAAIAAFAGSTVLSSSQTDQPAPNGGSHAGQTMFASLYAQSKAKTPIRNVDIGKTRRVVLPREGAPIDVGGPALPGVRNAASLFEIGQKASADYDADILDEASGEEGMYQTASISGLARLAPNGLMVQRPDVQTSCFQPDLVSIIKAVETRFHTKIVVTSGYRSPSHNLRVNGAKKSMHLQCKAADILVPGADKFQVANFVRGLPNRGGVGTYCHTAAIHVDTGRQRDWNWACRRGPSNAGNLILASQKTSRRISDD